VDNERGKNGRDRTKGTVPIFVSAKMGLSPLPGDNALTTLTQKSVQARTKWLVAVTLSVLQILRAAAS
jgi:hypothetical protein